MQIEPAQPVDLTAVVALARDCGLVATDSASLTHPATRVWIARVAEGIPVAFLHLWEVADELEIHDLAVSPEWRRRGIGRALVSEARSFGLARGKRSMVLEVRKSNLAARTLYASLGFLPVHTRRAYYADGEDAIVMQLDLTTVDDGASRLPVPNRRTSV